jgi:hypothetical protein
MIEALLFIISFTIGACKGITDRIMFYNNLKSLGYFWDRESWRKLYINPSWIEKKIGAVINAWHVFDWLRILLTYLLFFLAYFLKDYSFIDYTLTALLFLYIHYVGFKVFFRK